MLAPVYTDHNLMRGWRKFVQFQFQVIECVEGPAIAERFWNNCASHLTFAAACFGREHDYERALDYYSQYKKLGDKTNIFHYLVDDVLGRVCDLNDFQRQMLRPAFHSEMWSKPGGECYAPELVSTSVSPKQSYIIPPERRLLYQLRFSQTPIVTGDK